MPILRLVLIYLVLAFAVVAVFNRDKLGRLVFGDPPAQATAAAPQAATAQPMQPAAPVAPVATAQPVGAAQPAPQYPPISDEDLAGAPTAATNPAYATAPRPAPGMLQTPQAAQPQGQGQPARTAAPAFPGPGVAQTNPEVANALNAVRTAYWSGDVAGATDRLRALIAANPSDPDLHGELGNLHFGQRDWAAAAEAYAQAADILVAQGRMAQAAALVPVLSQIAPDKAQALASRLQNR